MSWYKIGNPGATGNDLFVPHVGTMGCCDDPKEPSKYANAATDLTSSAVTKIVIDGTEYTFTTPASTLALLKTGVDEAMAAAGYEDVKMVGTRTSGANATAVVSITTTAALTKLINAAAADIALTAS